MLSEQVLYFGGVVVYTAMFLGFAAHTLHNLVVSFSYPHKIQLDGTYWEKLRYTVTDRLAILRSLALLVGLLFLGNAGVIIFLAGLIHLFG